MRELFLAFGLVLFIEGAVLALMGAAWPRAVARMTALPDRTLRFLGIVFAASGLLWVALLR